MAFPVVESVTVTDFASDTTAHLVAMPATVNSGDLLVVIFDNNQNSTVTTPGTFTLLGTALNTDRLSEYYRIADGSEGGTTVDFVTSVARMASGQVYRISAWHGTTPPEIGIASVVDGTTTPDPPSLTPSWGAEDTLWLAICDGSTNLTTVTNPTNYTDQFRSNVVGATGVLVASARRFLNAASEDPGTWTLSASRDVLAQTLAIRPAGAGGATVDPYPYIGGGYYPTQG